MCDCKKKQTAAAAPTRSGACPYCTRKHLLKVRGYAREVAEDATREWERDNLLENLLLAEDHAAALGDEELRARIRTVRLAVENGAADAAEAAALYDWFRAKYFSVDPAGRQTSDREISAAELVVEEAKEP